MGLADHQAMAMEGESEVLKVRQHDPVVKSEKQEHQNERSLTRNAILVVGRGPIWMEGVHVQLLV